MRLSIIIAIGLAVGAVAWIGSGLLTDAPPATEGQNGQPSVAETEAARPFEVRVADLIAEPYTEEVALLGHTEANRMVEIAAEIDGTVAEVLVEEGMTVAAGAPIVRLEIDDLQAQVDQASALLEQRRIEYSAASQLSQSGYSARTQVATARANLNAAQSQLTSSQTQLARTEIAAPFDGTINERRAELGGYLRAGDSVATIVDLDPMIVVVHVTERQVNEVQIGAVAHARLVNGQSLEGVIRFVSAVADTATRTFRVEIEVANADSAIVDGLTADVRVPGRQIMAHKISPAVIALGDDGTIGVRIVDGDNRVQFVPITLLGDTTSGIWVTGLPERVTLITVGQEYVSSGQVVTPVYQPSGEIYDSADIAS